MVISLYRACTTNNCKPEISDVVVVAAASGSTSMVVVMAACFGVVISQVAYKIIKLVRLDLSERWLV